MRISTVGYFISNVGTSHVPNLMHKCLKQPLNLYHVNQPKYKVLSSVHEKIDVWTGHKTICKLSTKSKIFWVELFSSTSWERLYIYIDIQLLNIKVFCWGWNQWSAILPVHWPQQVYSWFFNTYGQMLIKFFVFLYAIQSRGGNKKEVDEPQESISLDPLQRMEVSSHYVGLVQFPTHFKESVHRWFHMAVKTHRTGLLSKKRIFQDKDNNCASIRIWIHYKIWVK